MPKKNKTAGSSKTKKMYPGNFKNFNEFMADCLERSRIRLRDEMGYGIPEVKQLNLFGDLFGDVEEND